jgi:glycosyltransferase involved in cell wall biosynthesis
MAVRVRPLHWPLYVLGPRGTLVHLAGALVTQDGISVIIPAYNLESFIDEAIASVMAQTWPVQEILAVDDGSTDGTEACLRAMAGQDARLRVLTSNRLGPGGARNVGLEAATRPVIAFLDGDDVWPPEKIARQMERLAAADRPDVVSGLIQRFRKLTPGTLMPADEPGEIMAHVNLGACLFRRQVFEVVGLLDAQLRNSEDVDLLFRVREAGLKLVIMREVMLYYRIRPGSLTQTQLSQDQQNVDTLKALRLSIGRRRKSGRPLELPPFTSLIE